MVLCVRVHVCVCVRVCVHACMCAHAGACSLMATMLHTWRSEDNLQKLLLSFHPVESWFRLRLDSV